MSPLSASGRRSLLYVVDLLRDGFSGRITFVCSQGGVRSVRTRKRLDSGWPTGDLDEGTKGYLALAADVLREGFSGDLVFEAERGSIDDVFSEIVSTPKDLPYGVGSYEAVV